MSKKWVIRLHNMSQSTINPKEHAIRKNCDLTKSSEDRRYVANLLINVIYDINMVKYLDDG